MTPLFALRSLLFAGELLAGSMIIMILAFVFAAQKRASARHLAWAGAFGTVLILPLLATIVPSPLRILLPAPPEAIPIQSLSDAASAATIPATVESGITLDPATIALALAAIWFLGMVILVLRFSISAYCLDTLRRRSRPYALAPEDMPRIAASHRECELRISDVEDGPITWGVLEPVILLPRTAVFWPRERLHAVLLHELAHIRRRDSLVQALSLFVCTLFWPNPLVWLGARALRREAEIAADDSVLLTGMKPSSYAGELLALAAEFRTRTPALSALSLFMAAPSALESRVESVLEPTSLRTGITTMDVIRITGLGFVAAAVIAFACPSLAQDTQSSQQVDVAPLPSLAPPTSSAPPSPAVPQTPVLPPLPAAPAVPSIDLVEPVHAQIHLRGLSRAERARIHSEIHRAERQAHKAIERARPEIERALADARSGEAAARAAREAQPAIDAAVANATREAHEAVERAKPEVERALADARIGEQAAEAVRAAEPAIDAAMDATMSKYDSRRIQAEVDRALVQAQRDIARAHIDERVSARVNAALERAQRKIDAASAREEAASAHGKDKYNDKNSGDDENDDSNDDSPADKDSSN